MTSIRLTGEEKFTHYASVWFAGMIAFGFSALTPSRPGHGSTPYILAAVAAVLAVLSYVRQKRALAFVRIDTLQNAAENYSAVLALAAAEGWQIQHRHKDHNLTMAVPGYPKNFLSWGERVTVEFHGGAVDVNSICDPACHPSVVSYGRNQANVSALAQAVCPMH